MMNTKTIRTISISALAVYAAIFLGLPALLLLVLFIGMKVTGDSGGQMFIPMVLVFGGIYFVIALAGGIVLAVIAWVVWSRFRRKEQKT